MEIKKKFSKLSLRYSQKFFANIVLSLVLVFFCYLSIDHQKLTKNSALESLLKSNLASDYTVIGLISHEIAEYPKDEYRFLIETKDEYVVANIYKNSLFYKQGRVYQFTKGKVTLIPLEVNDRDSHNFVHFVMITPNKNATFAKLKLQCRTYDNDIEDRKELVFQEDYSSEATKLANDYFYFKIDSKNTNGNASYYENSCFVSIGNPMLNILRSSLEGIRLEVELYDENHNILEVRELLNS